MRSSITSSSPKYGMARGAMSPKADNLARMGTPTHKEPTELQIIHQRYLALEENYQLLLKQCQTKNQQREDQREELEALRSQHQKDQREIERLTTLLKLGRETESVTKIERVGKGHKSVPKDRTGRERQDERTVRGIGGDSRMRKRGEQVVLKKHKFVPFLPLQ